MQHLGTKELNTPRLRLRRFTLADTEAMYHNWASDPEVTRFLRWQPHQSTEQTRQLLSAWGELYPNPDYYQWFIEEKASGQPIGTISLFDNRLEPHKDNRPSVWVHPLPDCSGGIWEVGYCIGRPWWGKGLTTEALHEIVRFWFTEVEGDFLLCCHALENKASGAVMHKVGFVYDHNAVYHKFDGTPVECRLHLLTREGWLSASTATKEVTR